MNSEIIEIIKEKKLHPKAYQKIKSVFIIKGENESYVIKLNTNNYDIYKYLISKKFLNFPVNYNNSNDNYDISSYINKININKEQKINDYVQIIALLHYKTSYKREIDLDEIKEKYEKLNEQIISLQEYYLDLNNKIDCDFFLSPSSYLLIRNISLIYQIISIILKLLNDVYDILKNEKSIRISLLHNNIDLDHLIINENEYLISWDKSSFDSPIYEINNLYRKYYQDITLNDLLKIYEKINPLTKIEKKRLLILLSIPKQLQLTVDTYSDTLLINDEIRYLKGVYELLIKYENDL